LPHPSWAQISSSMRRNKKRKTNTNFQHIMQLQCIPRKSVLTCWCWGYKIRWNGQFWIKRTAALIQNLNKHPWSGDSP
jgi:hypothetical protein